MESNQKKGAPFDGSTTNGIDDWSLAIYDALREWVFTRLGTWTQWEPGYLLSELGSAACGEIEPAIFYTADQELTVFFGYWEAHLPAPGDSDLPCDVAKDARILVERWLSGELRTAVITNPNGEWCGSALIEPGELSPQLKKAVQWVRDFGPSRVEVRSAKRRDWAVYEVEADWLGTPPLSPDRLP